MRYAFDIDGTICTNRDELRIEKNDDSITYLDMKPYSKRIQLINKLYDQGHEIVYWTARGGTTNIDWSDLTKKQLNEWCCKYTRIETQKKPYYDLFIDDKTKRIDEI